MKKLLLLICSSILLITGCQKKDASSNVLPEEFMPAERSCGTYEHQQALMLQDPSLLPKITAIENFTSQVLANPLSARRLADGTIEISVVVNVLYRSEDENISDAQVASQIKALNQDYAAANTDYNKTTAFSEVKSGNTGIRFVLEKINRKRTKKRSFGMDDSMKFSSSGGIDATSTSNTLNIWVCNLGNLLGYAQFPGGNPLTDGVVCDDNAFGTTGTVKAPFNLGRTATHEIGHWAGLRHIWGDAPCGTDLVEDTPQHDAPNYGCPPEGILSTCADSPVEMTMNYMDYSNDACMYMFTKLQAARMKTLFEPGGPRSGFGL